MHRQKFKKESKSFKRFLSQAIKLQYREKIVRRRFREELQRARTLYPRKADAIHAALSATVEYYRQLDEMTAKSSVMPKAPIVISADELLARKDEDPPWLVTRLVREESIIISAGAGESGKSFFVLGAVVRAAAGGGELLPGMYAEPMEVLYIDLENGERRLRRRVRQLKHGMGLDGKSLSLSFMTDVNLKLDRPVPQTPEEWLANRALLRVVQHIEKHGVRLIVIDSLVRFMQGGEDVEEVKRVFETLSWISKTYHVAFIVIAHTRKKSGMKTGDDLRGSSDLRNQVDGLFIFNEIEPQSISVTADKSRDNDLKDFAFRLVDVYDNPLTHLTGANGDGVLIELINVSISPRLATAQVIGQEVQQWYECASKVKFTTKEAVDAFSAKYSRQQIQKALKHLFDRRDLKNPTKGHWEVAVPPLPTAPKKVP